MGAVKSPLVEVGVAARALQGQAESGDLHVVVPYPDGLLVAVVDGLGHGNEAASAAREAVSALKSCAPQPGIALLRYCHEKLRPTRGVVLSLALFNAQDETMTWLGVGNVEGMLIRADPQAQPPIESLMLRGGVVGGQLPLLSASVISLLRGDTLIFTTDGIQSSFAEALVLPGSAQKSAETILSRYAKETDDALVLVARYLGCAQGKPC